MSLLEKIIFVADSASVDRKCKHSAGIRKLARKDIEKAFIKALSKNNLYNRRKEPIFPQTIITWNYMSPKTKNIACHKQYTAYLIYSVHFCVYTYVQK